MTDLDPVKALNVTVPEGPLTRGIRQQVEAAIAANVPAGKHGAVLAVMDQNGPQFGMAMKAGEHWILAADARVKWTDHKVTGQVAVVYTW